MRKRVTTPLRIVVCVLAGLIWSQLAYSQVTIKQVTRDSTVFLEEITKLLQDSRKKEGKDFIEEFTPVWFGGKFSERERRVIYDVCDVMLKKRMRPFPDFKNYLGTCASFVNTDQPESSFEAWQRSLEILIGARSKQKFITYLEFCDNLFSENAIYKSGTTTWKSSTTSYSFEVEGKNPKIVIPALDLICYAKNDSAVVYGTQGVYYPTLRKWVGKGGKVTWERAGFAKDQVFAELRNYRIDTRKSSYIADSVTFHNTIYFDKPLEGAISEKVLANVEASKASYPQFSSYSKRLKIANIIPDVDFDGGFAQRGAKFIGTGDEEKKALLIMHRKQKPFMIASSRRFTIRPERITSSVAAIKIYLEEDSITHPGLKFRLLTKERKIALLRTDEGVHQSPYFNSYHKIDMYFNELNWNMDDPLINMGPLTGTSDRSAAFESDDYFKESRFDKLQGLDQYHPLSRIKNCADQVGVDVLQAEDISRCMRISISQIRPMLMRLSNMGFLYYDYETNEVQLKDRLYNYIQAKSKKRDYDVLSLNSNMPKQGIQKSNASLNLLNLDMNVRRLREIYLSDSHDVFIIPAGQEITLRKNRDFSFSGEVNAGKFQFFGTEYYFSYDDFKIDMPQVDSVRLFVETGKKDEYGRRYVKRVKTVVEDVTGELLIDQPGNKSGLKRLPEYPIFKSLKDSYVFYQRPSIQRGVYKRDNFYFHLEPFVFDSLDNFSNEGLRFKGTFVSANIFPDFDETLTLQPDYSLGFTRKTPKEGYPMYGGKGVFKKEIKMSHEGLRGDGTLKYLTSTAESDDFIFFPDSVNGVAYNYVLEEQMNPTQYPPVTGEDVYLHWEPYNDFMTVKSQENPLVFYDGNSNLKGQIKLEPSKLTGGGLFSFEEAELESDLFTFQFSEFFSDTADFRFENRGYRGHQPVVICDRQRKCAHRLCQSEGNLCVERWWVLCEVPREPVHRLHGPIYLVHGR